MSRETREIQAELEKMERMLHGDVEVPVESTTAKRKPPLWLIVVAGAAAIDLAARFFVPSSDRFVLILEACLFLVVAAVLTVPLVRRRADLSSARRRFQTILAACFGLAALRAGLWGAGLAVELANLTIFILGIILVGIAYVRSRQTKSRDEKAQT